jgi:hypothetical protein
MDPFRGREAAPVLPGADVARRAREYQAARATAAAETPSEEAAAGERPQQRFLSLLAGFLEEKNIRWGELVGGLLIVGCSLALVISFWSSIAERPFLKFGLFNGVTALLYLLGIHAERRWSLPTTARGLFVIATLLAPLNFLAVASLSRGTAAGSPWVAVGELGAAAAFTWLTYRAGQSLVSRAPAALTVGVLGPSVAMLLVRRWAGPGCGSAVLLALGAAPLLAQAGALGGLIRRARREPEVGEALAQEILAPAGADGLRRGSGRGPADRASRAGRGDAPGLAPLAPLAGASVLAPGLLLWRRTTAAELVGYRTAGTAVAAAGTLLMLAGVALAWPDPAGMLPVALLSFGVLTAVALAFEVPAAHALAGACLVLAYLLGLQVATGGLGWTGATAEAAASALLSSRSGSALVPLVLLSAVVAGVGLRRGRRLDAQAYALVAALAGLFSLGLVTWLGFGRAGDPAGATWVYGAYALAALAAAAWFGRNPLVAGTSGRRETDVLAWLGAALALAAAVQGIVYGGTVTPGLPWVVAPLAHATLALAAASLIAAARGTTIRAGGGSASS